jgi:hypothetical protein
MSDVHQLAPTHLRHRHIQQRLDPFTDRLMQRGSEHLCQLGPRALSEFHIELASRIGGLPAILGLLNEFELRLTPAMLRVVLR